ncbi:MAG: hypothetical protein ABJA78_20645 [Ferruginibacter sp.]
MKTYKYIDAIIQLILIIGAVSFVILLVNRSFSIDRYNFIFCYFIVGGYQLFSCLANAAFIKKQYKIPARRDYHKTLLVLSICVAISFPIGAGIFILGALLLISPLIAVLYCLICFKELKLFYHENE